MYHFPSFWCWASIPLVDSIKALEIQLSEEHRSVIEGLVASGRFLSAEDAVLQGVRLLAANERLRSHVQIGIDQAERGDVYDHDTVFAQLKAMASQAVADNG